MHFPNAGATSTSASTGTLVLEAFEKTFPRPMTASAADKDRKDLATDRTMSLHSRSSSLTGTLVLEAFEKTFPRQMTGTLVLEAFEKTFPRPMTASAADFLPVSTIVKITTDDINHGVYGGGASQLLHATHITAEQVQIQNLMVGNNGFTVNWNGNAATAVDTLEEIHYHLKKFQLEITGFTFNWDDNLANAIDTLEDTEK
jgi:hypothetical protein